MRSSILTKTVSIIILITFTFTGSAFPTASIPLALNLESSPDCTTARPMPAITAWGPERARSELRVAELLGERIPNVFEGNHARAELRNDSADHIRSEFHKAFIVTAARKGFEKVIVRFLTGDIHDAQISVIFGRAAKPESGEKGDFDVAKVDLSRSDLDQMHFALTKNEKVGSTWKSWFGFFSTGMKQAIYLLQNQPREWNEELQRRLDELEDHEVDGHQFEVTYRVEEDGEPESLNGQKLIINILDTTQEALARAEASRAFFSNLLQKLQQLTHGGISHRPLGGTVESFKWSDESFDYSMVSAGGLFGPHLTLTVTRKGETEVFREETLGGFSEPDLFDSILGELKSKSVRAELRAGGSDSEFSKWKYKLIGELARRFKELQFEEDDDEVFSFNSVTEVVDFAIRYLGEETFKNLLTDRDGFLGMAHETRFNFEYLYEKVDAIIWSEAKGQAAFKTLFQKYPRLLGYALYIITFSDDDEITPEQVTGMVTNYFRELRGEETFIEEIELLVRDLIARPPTRTVVNETDSFDSIIAFLNEAWDDVQHEIQVAEMAGKTDGIVKFRGLFSPKAKEQFFHRMRENPERFYRIISFLYTPLKGTLLTPSAVYKQTRRASTVPGRLIDFFSTISFLMLVSTESITFEAMRVVRRINIILSQHLRLDCYYLALRLFYAMVRDGRFGGRDTIMKIWNMDSTNEQDSLELLEKVLEFLSESQFFQPPFDDEEFLRVLGLIKPFPDTRSELRNDSQLLNQLSAADLRKVLTSALSEKSYAESRDIAFKNAADSEKTFVAGIVVLRKIDGQWKILVGERTAKASNEIGKAMMPAGKVEAGEEVRRAAIRELEEEAGLSISADDLSGEVIPFVGWQDDVVVSHMVYVDSQTNTDIPGGDGTLENFSWKSIDWLNEHKIFSNLADVFKNAVSLSHEISARSEFRNSPMDSSNLITPETRSELRRTVEQMRELISTPPLTGMLEGVTRLTGFKTFKPATAQDLSELPVLAFCPEVTMQLADIVAQVTQALANSQLRVVIFARTNEEISVLRALFPAEFQSRINSGDILITSRTNIEEQILRGAKRAELRAVGLPGDAPFARLLQQRFQRVKVILQIASEERILGFFSEFTETLRSELRAQFIQSIAA